MILAISSRTDEHTVAVLAELGRLGAPAAVLDLSDFPQRLQLSMRYGRGLDRRFEIVGDDLDLALEDCRAIWWRRPQPFAPDPAIRRAGDVAFTYSESAEAFEGLWQAVDALWVNHPTRDQVASRKAYQLRVAQQVGLPIPVTLITNSPEQASEFAARNRPENTVYKTFSATEQEWRETRILRPEELQLLDRVRFAPVIFQEYVKAQVDLRVTVAGEEVFPAAIHSQQTAYKVDFRMDMANARIEPWQLPDEVRRQVLALMHALGLVYGAIDMRLAEDARYVFLEINPAGQWLFIEERTRQPITAALAKLLARQEADGTDRRPMTT